MIWIAAIALLFGALTALLAWLFLRTRNKRKHRRMNTKEHYVSKALIKRFANEQNRIERFKLEFGKWDTTAPKAVFKAIGYNQLLAFGTFDDSLDVTFKELEQVLPKTLDALDDIAANGSKLLTADIFEHLCWYCAFIWHMCPFKKAVSQLDFTMQLDLDLKSGKVDMLKAIGIKDSHIEVLQKHHAEGNKSVIVGKHYLQMVYRIQFRQNCEWTHKQFKHYTKWTVYNSPIELPISDHALIQYQLNKAIVSVLPISPTSVLIGICALGENLPPSTDTTIGSSSLTKIEAECIRDTICASAQLAIASKTRIGDINAFRKSAAEHGITFLRIKNVQAVLSAGEKAIESELEFGILTVKAGGFKEFADSILSRP